MSLGFAGIPLTRVPCNPPAQQLAEKLHAYTRPHHGRPGSRVKDLIDILLLGELAPLSATALRSAVEATFETRGTHQPPVELPEPPSAWQTGYRRIASEVGMDTIDLVDGFDAARRFLNPILGSAALKTWNPQIWKWE